VRLGDNIGGEVNGKMFGLQGTRGIHVRRVWNTGVHVPLHNDIRRYNPVDEILLRQLHRKEDARLGQAEVVSIVKRL